MSLTSDICDYDPQWPALFEAERLRIQEKLGHLVREIHHVGSTAVPGMKGKPEIDLLIVVTCAANVELKVGTITARTCNPPEPIRRMCVKLPTRTSPGKLHFVTICGITQRTPKNTQYLR